MGNKGCWGGTITSAAHEDYDGWGQMAGKCYQSKYQGDEHLLSLHIPLLQIARLTQHAQHLLSDNVAAQLVPSILANSESRIYQPQVRNKSKFWR